MKDEYFHTSYFILHNFQSSRLPPELRSQSITIQCERSPKISSPHTCCANNIYIFAQYEKHFILLARLGRFLLGIYDWS